jgi:hypothetical protein
MMRVSITPQTAAMAMNGHAFLRTVQTISGIMAELPYTVRNMDIRITINDKTLLVEPDAWDVLMRSINVLVDTGDIVVSMPAITSGQLAKAKLASGALLLMTRRPALLPSTPTVELPQ